MHSSTLSAIAFVAALMATSATTQTMPISETARHFLAVLSEDERAQATWSFDDAERKDIHYAPMGLDGLRHGGLAANKYQAGEDLLSGTLSARGLSKLRAIRLLERDVRALEGTRSRPGFRDPGRYHWAFFGAPARDTPWGFRYEGHHLSLNVTAVAGQTPASLPLFLGAQPRKVPAGLPRRVLRRSAWKKIWHGSCMPVSTMPSAPRPPCRSSRDADT